MKHWSVIFATLLGLCIWQALITLTDAPHFILPSPWRVAKAAYESRLIILQNAWVTSIEVVLGLLIGTMLGAVTAIQLAMSKTVERLVLPVLVFTQAVPVFALAPLLTLWFGYGMGSKIVMAVLIIYFPVTSAFHDGLTRMDPGYRDLSIAMGANRWSLMFYIQIPQYLPAVRHWHQRRRRIVSQWIQQSGHCSHSCLHPWFLSHSFCDVLPAQV